MPYRSITAACLAGIALAACGSQAPAAPAGSGRAPAAGLPAGLSGAASGPADASLAGLHACALIPAATVARDLGPLAGPCYGPQNGTGTLAFYDLGAPGDAVATVSLTIVERSGFDASQSFAAGVASSGGAQVRSVPGLGDSAFSISTKGSQDYQLWAASGGRGLEIDIDSTTPADEAGVRQLMAAALAAL